MHAQMPRVTFAGGVRTGGYPKTAPVSGPLGFQRPSDWDLLWSPARSALKAVPTLKAGQLVSAVPGLYSLTKKVRPAAEFAGPASNQLRPGNLPEPGSQLDTCHTVWHAAWP